nr:MAG TPA: hypothetical protein [Caudoviricetes sp.]
MKRHPFHLRPASKPPCCCSPAPAPGTHPPLLKRLPLQFPANMRQQVGKKPRQNPPFCSCGCSQGLPRASAATPLLPPPG